MSHVDEGQLHAYLDGELPAIGGDVDQVERHLASCPECGRALEDARSIHARAVAMLREASPPETIVPPFEGVIGRALSPRGATDMREELLMDNAATADLGLAKPRFKHLVASGGEKRRPWNSRSVAMSIFLHSALVVAAVYATVRAEEVTKEEELVEFMEIEEEEKAPEPEKPDEPEPPPPPPAATQALEPPEAPPASIPEVDLSAPAVSAADFTGIGVVAPEAAPAPPAPPPEAAPDFAYEVAVLERVPELSNKGSIGSIMERLYPRLLQDAGIGGTVVMQFVIEPDGTVDMSSAKVLESSNDQLSEASMKAIERFRFRPGRYKGENVRVLIQMPITWQAAG